jgi:hypothetical protein
MRAIQRLKLRPVRPSNVFRHSKDRRLIWRLVVSPLPIEVQPGEGVISATSFESRRGRVVGVCVGVEYGVPQDSAVCVVQQESNGEVDAWDAVVVFSEELVGCLCFGEGE